MKKNTILTIIAVSIFSFIIASCSGKSNCCEKEKKCCEQKDSTSVEMVEEQAEK